MQNKDKRLGTSFLNIGIRTKCKKVAAAYNIACSRARKKLAWINRTMLGMRRFQVQGANWNILQELSPQNMLQKISLITGSTGSINRWNNTGRKQTSWLSGTYTHV